MDASRNILLELLIIFDRFRRFRDLGGSVGYVVDPFFLYRTGPYLLLVEFLLVTG